MWYICGEDEGVQADICVTNEITESQTDGSIEWYNQEKAQSEKRFPLQKTEVGNTKLTIRYLYVP